MVNKTAAIIVAAGSSTRMGDVPKQFIKLCGKEVIYRTAEVFQSAEVIDEIILVCKREDQAQLSRLMAENNITKLRGIAYGGATRQQSVMNGLSLLSKDTTHIAIHDGARPLVSKTLVEQTVRSAYEHGASAPGVPVKDTIKVVSYNGTIEQTPDRSTLYAIQTPQVFEKISYLHAMEAAGTIGADYTDDCALAEMAEIAVFVTQGDYENIKITTPEDVEVAEGILKRRGE